MKSKKYKTLSLMMGDLRVSVHFHVINVKDSESVESTATLFIYVSELYDL